MNLIEIIHENIINKNRGSLLRVTLFSVEEARGFTSYF